MPVDDGSGVDTAAIVGGSVAAAAVVLLALLAVMLFARRRKDGGSKSVPPQSLLTTEAGSSSIKPATASSESAYGSALATGASSTPKQLPSWLRTEQLPEGGLPGARYIPPPAWAATAGTRPSLVTLPGTSTADRSLSDAGVAFSTWSSLSPRPTQQHLTFLPSGASRAPADGTVNTPSAAGAPVDIAALEETLLHMHATGERFMGQYVVLGATEQRAGGQGVVQFALLPELSRPVALKVRPSPVQPSMGASEPLSCAAIAEYQSHSHRCHPSSKRATCPRPPAVWTAAMARALVALRRRRSMWTWRCTMSQEPVKKCTYR